MCHPVILPTRFPDAKHISDEDWLHQSVHESEVRSYWIGYPGLQKMAGRNVRKSPLWDTSSKRGAFFGLGGGHWEVPKFYMPGTTMPVQGVSSVSGVGFG